MEPSEESNDMILNHPDIESVEIIRNAGEENEQSLENKKLKEDTEQETPLKKLTEEEALKQREEKKIQKLERRRLREENRKIKEENQRIRKEDRQRRLEEKQLAEKEALKRREEREKQKLENEKIKQEKREERKRRNLEIERLRIENKQRRLEEKRVAEEEALKIRKEQALKGMQYLLTVSSKYSDFFKEKLTTNKNESNNGGKPLQERNKLQPTISDMQEAVNVGKQKLGIKDTGDITKQLKYFEGGELREYQIDGVKWMVNLFDNGINGILADEMGLGKTVQVIALIAHLMEIWKIFRPCLIVAPLSTIPNWEMEFRRFAPQIPVVSFHGSAWDRRQAYTAIKRKYKIGNFQACPVVMTTYQVPLLEQHFFRTVEWQYIIIDEGHRVKNHESKLSIILRSLNSSNRLLLTGTPLHNNITELWALLNFLMPHIFNHVDTFAALLMLEDVQDENRLIEQEEKTNFLSTLHRVLEPFVLRRLKKDVLNDIVPKKELSIYCPLTKLQHDLYNYVINRNMAMLKQIEEEVPLGPRRKKKRVNYCEPKENDSFADYEEELLKAEELKLGGKIEKEQLPFIVRLTMTNPTMMFKKIVDHPYLVHFPLDPDTSTKRLLVNDDLILNSGKMMVLDQVLARLKRDGHKVLIFSTLVMTLDVIEEAFIMKGYKYCRLDGGMHLEDRKENIDSFNKDPNILAFLLSTRAGGLGLNLTGADTVIFFDRDWNPQVDIQAQDRCHRIGQTKPVMVYTLVAKNTIDDIIINKGFKKRLLEKIVIKDGKFQTTKQDEMIRLEDELIELQQLLKEEAKDFDNLTIPCDELDKLLDRSELWAQMRQEQENKL